MSRSTHSARILVPVSYTGAGGVPASIPLGPCLLERIDDNLVDIVWGSAGQASVELTMKDFESATERGDLVLLD